MPIPPANGRVIASGTVRRIGLFAVPAVASTWMSAGVKHLSADLCPFEVGFFRSVFGLLALTSVSLRRGFNVFGGLSFMFGLSLVPLAKLTALQLHQSLVHERARDPRH